MGRGFLGLANGEDADMKDRSGNSGSSPDAVISIVGPGMKVVGDCETDGTIRVDGYVDGTVKAGKAVIVGKEGVVEGDIQTQDAVISGRVKGTLTAESRLELDSTCRVEGEIYAGRMKLEEGALLNGMLHMGKAAGRKADARSGVTPNRGEDGARPGTGSGGGGPGSAKKKGEPTTAGV